MTYDSKVTPSKSKAKNLLNIEAIYHSQTNCGILLHTFCSKVSV